MEFELLLTLFNVNCVLYVDVERTVAETESWIRFRQIAPAQNEKKKNKQQQQQFKKKEREEEERE